ncbi:MAG: hypothetical protein ACLP5V_08405 [Candidatus Bathyarchaeia archaeon]
MHPHSDEYKGFEVNQLIGIKQGETGCDFGCYYKSVITSGEARVVDSETVNLRILEKLVSKYAQGHQTGF